MTPSPPLPPSPPQPMHRDAVPHGVRVRPAGWPLALRPGVATVFGPVTGQGAGDHATLRAHERAYG